MELHIYRIDYDWTEQIYQFTYRVVDNIVETKKTYKMPKRFYFPGMSKSEIDKSCLNEAFHHQGKLFLFMAERNDDKAKEIFSQRVKEEMDRFIESSNDTIAKLHSKMDCIDNLIQ